MGDDRPTTYVDEATGLVIYRASGTGNCIKGLVASRLGLTPEDHPDWLLDKFAEGVKAEPIILDRFAKETGWKLLDPHDPGSYANLGPMVSRNPHDDQFLLEIPVGSKVIIRCHLDGIGYCYMDRSNGRMGQTRVVEVKAFGKTYWDKYLKQGIMAFPYYSAQLSIQMYGTGLPGIFVVAQKDADGELTGEWNIDYYDEPPVSMGSIKAKIAKVESHVARGALPDCDFNQYPCQFYYLHDDGGEPAPVTEIGEGVMSDMFDTACEGYLRGQALEKEGKALKKANGDIIKQWFDDEKKKGEKVESGRYEVQDYVEQRKDVTIPGYELRYPKIKEKGREGG